MVLRSNNPFGNNNPQVVAPKNIIKRNQLHATCVFCT